MMGIRWERWGRKPPKDIEEVTDWPPILPPARDDYPAKPEEARFTMEDIAAALGYVYIEETERLKSERAGEDDVLSWRQGVSAALKGLGFVYTWNPEEGVTALATPDGTRRIGIGDSDVNSMIAGGVDPMAAAHALAGAVLDSRLAWWLDLGEEEIV